MHLGNARTIRTFFLVLITCGQLHAQSGSKPPTQPAESLFLAERVHHVLQQNAREHHDLIGALDGALANVGTDVSKISIPTADLNHLVDALLEGDADDRLLHTQLGFAHIQKVELIDPKAKTHLPSYMRQFIPKYLLSTSMALKDVDQKAAARYAKAAALCAAYDEFKTYSSGLISIVNSKDVPFSKLAALDPTQEKALATLITEEVAFMSRFSRSRRALAFKLDDWMDDKSATLAPDRRDEFLNETNLFWTASEVNKRPAIAWAIANLTWNFLNMARDRKDQATIKAIQDMLDSWQSNLVDPDMRRWLDEAKAISGPVPSRFMHIWDIDGKEITDPAVRAQFREGLTR